MTVSDVVILGAGPCGLSTAIALAKANMADSSVPPVRITVIELRPTPQPIGGTVNMTPLGLRYLHYLGAGKRVEERSISLDTGVDYVSLRTGQRLGNIWGGIGARRVARMDLLESLLEAVAKDYPDTIKIEWGRRVTNISERDDKVILEFDDQSTRETDLLLGCDGIHSAARLLYVEPDRKKMYTGRAVAMGWVQGVKDADQPASPIALYNGQPALRDTVGISGNGSTLIMSYYEPKREDVFFAHVTWQEEPKESNGENGRDGWKIRGKDQEAITREVVEAYGGGQIKGLANLVSKCEKWQLYPIYSLPPGGRWHRGRVLLLGDAGHAMPPQGESTGIAIEDGILFTRILQRRETRSLEQMFSDFETLRRTMIDKHYASAERLANFGFMKKSSFFAILMEYVTAIFMLIKRWTQGDVYAGDVRDLKLP